jgi:hypothetical protein
MSFGRWYHQLEKVAIPHEEIAKPAAVYIAPLRSQLEKGWVNEQLFVAIAFRATRAGCVWLCLRLQMAVIVDSHITDVGGQVEDALYQGALQFIDRVILNEGTLPDFSGIATGHEIPLHFCSVALTISLATASALSSIMNSRFWVGKNLFMRCTSSFF